MIYRVKYQCFIIIQLSSALDGSADCYIIITVLPSVYLQWKVYRLITQTTHPSLLIYASTGDTATVTYICTLVTVLKLCIKVSIYTYIL